MNHRQIVQDLIRNQQQQQHLIMNTVRDWQKSRILHFQVEITKPQQRETMM